MRTRTSAVTTSLLLMTLCGVSTAVDAQTLIDSNRRIDWSQAGAIGGIVHRTTVCATLNPGASANQINSAIASCPSGQVVQLNAGTYTMSTGLIFDNKNNVTLRGAGPDQTFLLFNDENACRGLGGAICVSGNNTAYLGGPAHSVNWTAGYAKGATSITLSSTSGLSVGMLLYLDQKNDANSDPGTIWVCDAGGVCADEGPSGAYRSGRAQNQIVKVTAISGNTVTISPGLYMPNWRSSQSPQAFYGTSTSDHVEGVGIEDLSLDSKNTGGMSAIYFLYAYNSWVQNVRSLNGPRNHVWLYQSAHVTVSDSYFYGTKNAASQSYGVEFFLSSDNLVENNIFQHITGPITINGSASGSVIAYNYMIDDYYTVSANWMIPSNIAHAAGTNMILTEGNEGIGFEADGIHGTHHFMTAFRNYFKGESGKSANTGLVHLYAFSRYFNVIGNVLGSSFYNTYEGNSDRAIFQLGDDPGGGVPSDPKVATTLLRWGNYDTVTGTTRFQSSEVPSGLSVYANAVPSSQTLPVSLYLSGKPGWWGDVPWPAIGPDVSGGNGPGGHSYDIPAKQCYDNTSKSSSILNFNADNCYSERLPGAPSNLRIIR